METPTAMVEACLDQQGKCLAKYEDPLSHRQNAVWCRYNIHDSSFTSAMSCNISCSDIERRAANQDVMPHDRCTQQKQDGDVLQRTVGVRPWTDNEAGRTDDALGQTSTAPRLTVDAARLGEFVATLPTVQRGRFQVTQLELLASDADELDDEFPRSLTSHLRPHCQKPEGSGGTQLAPDAHQHGKSDTKHLRGILVLKQPTAGDAGGQNDLPVSLVTPPREATAWVVGDGGGDTASGDIQIASQQYPLAGNGEIEALLPPTSTEMPRKKSVRFSVPVQKAVSSVSLSSLSLDHEKATQKEEEEAEEGELVDLQLPPTPSSASFTTSTRIGGDDDDDDDERPWTRVFLHYGDNLDFARCSIRSFRPQWLQVLARQEVYLLLYCLLGVTHGVIHTFVISVISTIEKNFRLSSKQTGVVLAGSGAAQATVSALLPLYGRSVHRGRWSGVGVVAGVASCMLALASQVVYGSGGTTRDASGQMEKTEVCFSGGTREDEESCDALAGESYIGPVVLLFISQFFVGIAISIFYSIGVTYLDDNINKHSPQYLGITLLLRVVGPVCGFLLGGSCLWVWVHPFQDPPDQARDDPRWLGSWWIGFLLVGCCVLVLGGLLFLFRHKVALTRRGARPGRRRRASTRLWKIDEFTIFTTMWKEATLSIQDLPKILKRLFNNKIWVGHLLSSVAFFLALACYYNFKTKYLETEFRKSASEANFYTGLVTLVGSLLGMAVSTALGKWAPQGPRFLASCDILFSVLVCTSFLGLMFIGCPRLQVVGPGEGTGEGACSAECGCSDRFSPLCLVQDQTILFYSACYAGCLTVDASSMPLVYGSCLCISHGANSLTQLDLPGTAGLKSAVLNMTATSGYCPEPCGYFVYYLAVQVLTNTIYATGRLGDSLIYLRGASEEDKEVSLGTIAVFVSLFGILPAPIIMGAAIDWTCSVWEKQCGEAGHCWLYATHAFRLLLHLIPAVFTFLSVFGEVVVFYYSHKLDLYGDRDDDVTIEKPEDTSTEDDEKAKCLTSTSARRLTSIP